MYTNKRFNAFTKDKREEQALKVTTQERGENWSKNRGRSEVQTLEEEEEAGEDKILTPLSATNARSWDTIEVTVQSGRRKQITLSMRKKNICC